MIINSPKNLHLFVITIFVGNIVWWKTHCETLSCLSFYKETNTTVQRLATIFMITVLTSDYWLHDTVCKIKWYRALFLAGSAVLWYLSTSHYALFQYCHVNKLQARDLRVCRIYRYLCSPVSFCVIMYAFVPFLDRCLLNI